MRQIYIQYIEIFRLIKIIFLFTTSLNIQFYFNQFLTLLSLISCLIIENAIKYNLLFFLLNQCQSKVLKLPRKSIKNKPVFSSSPRNERPLKQQLNHHISSPRKKNTDLLMQEALVSNLWTLVNFKAIFFCSRSCLN